MSKKAIIVGASGLIGSILLKLLLDNDSYDAVLILVRKELLLSHKKLTQKVIDFDKLSGYGENIMGDALFCCLGSTRKKTPNLADYRKIDHDYPLQLAQIAKQNGIKQYHLVSAVGANSQSSNFYTKMKGEIEDELKKIGLDCLHIYQPSFLTGNRQEQRSREGVAVLIMKILNPFLIGGLKKYRSIPAETVAKAMLNESLKNQEGVFLHPSDKIKLLA